MYFDRVCLCVREKFDIIEKVICILGFGDNIGYGKWFNVCFLKKIVSCIG